MANVFAWLLAAALPIARKILVGLGIGWVTYESFGFLVTQLQNAVIGAWGQVGGVTFQILSLAGVPESLGIVLGGFSARAALMAVARLGKIAT